MSFIRFFKDISKADVAIAGGKGASLGEMTRAHIPVPSGFVILASAFDFFIKETQLEKKIISQLKKIYPNDSAVVERISKELRELIGECQLPQHITAEITTAYRELGAQFVAVRSSATAEDSDAASWAGELETYLNTTEAELSTRVKQCWSSLFTPRALFYRYEKKLIDEHVSVAVVVQTMVQSEISGIAFTVHPDNEDPNQIIIEAGYGLGEAIVSGQVTPDSYIIDKKEMTILDVQIGEQSKKLIKSGKNLPEANEWVKLGADGNTQKLTGRNIIKLAEICRDIELHYGFPCDIEWAFAEQKFYITQSRPITTLKR